MSPLLGFSPQALTVLAALSSQPSQWRHGYEMASDTGLKSGTLYPILIRLADKGLLESRWQDEPALGRPRRHLYRLTSAGLAAATVALGEVPGAGYTTRAARPARPRRIGPARALPEAG